MDANDLQLFQQMMEALDNEAGEAVQLDEVQRVAAQATSALLETGVMLASAVQAEYLGRDEVNAFYYVPVPLTVHPEPGTHFEDIQVRLIFNPGQGLKPAVNDIFPPQQFVEQLKMEGTLKIGVSDVFEFAALALGGGAAQKLVKTLVEATSLDDLKVHKDYSYLVRKGVIQTSPVGADTAQWVLRDRDLFEQNEHLKLGFVMRVPLELTSVLVACELSARKRNDSIRQRLLHDIKRLEDMRDFIRKMFGDKGFDALAAIKNRLENSQWNVEQKDLPAWKLDSDLVHTYG